MSTDINNVNIVGRLTRDGEIKYSTSGVAIMSLSLANSQSRKQGDQWVDEAHFFECTLLGRRADALSKYLTKGTQIAIQGKLQQERWQDKQSGQNRSKIKILIDDIQLLSGNRQNSGGSTAPASGDDDGFY